MKLPKVSYIVFCMSLYQIVETLESVKHQSGHITIASLLPIKSVNHYHTRSYNVQGSNQSRAMQAARLTEPSLPPPAPGAAAPCPPHSCILQSMCLMHGPLSLPARGEKTLLERSRFFLQVHSAYSIS